MAVQLLKRLFTVAEYHRMTMCYSHLSQDHLQQTVKLLDGLQGKEPWRKKRPLQEGSGMV